jgi:hypothetical protein
LTALPVITESQVLHEGIIWHPRWEEGLAVEGITPA